MKNKNVRSNLLISKITKLALVLVLALFSFFGGATLLLQNSTAAKLQNSTDSEQTVHAYDVYNGIAYCNSEDDLQAARSAGYTQFALYVHNSEELEYVLENHFDESGVIGIVTIADMDVPFDITIYDGCFIAVHSDYELHFNYHNLSINHGGSFYVDGYAGVPYWLDCYGYMEVNGTFGGTSDGFYVYEGGELYLNNSFNDSVMNYGGTIHYNTTGSVTDVSLYTTSNDEPVRPLVYVDQLPSSTQNIHIYTDGLTEDSYEFLRFSKSLTYQQVSSKFTVSTSGSGSANYPYQTTPVDHGDYYSLYLGELSLVTTEAELRTALEAGKTNIILGANFSISGVINIPDGVTITQDSTRTLTIANTGVVNMTGGSLTVGTITCNGRLNMAGGSITATIDIITNGPGLSLANIYSEPSITGTITLIPSASASPYIYLASPVSNTFTVTLRTVYLGDNDVASYQVLKYASNVSQANAVKTNFTLTSIGYQWKTAVTATTDTDGSTCYAWEVEADYLVITYYSYNDSTSLSGSGAPQIDASGYDGRLYRINTSTQYNAYVSVSSNLMMTTKVYRNSVTAKTITLAAPSGGAYYVSTSALGANTTYDLTSLDQYRGTTYTWEATRGIKTINVYVYSTHTATFYSTSSTAYSTKYFVYNRNHTKPTDPIKTGFTYYGWSTGADATREWDTSASSVRKDTADQNFYAVWKKGWTFYDTSSLAPSYTRTYVYNASATQSYSKANPSLSGYTFLGYAESNTYLPDVKAGSSSTSVSSSSATPTFYAVWSDTSGTRNEYVTLTHKFYKTSSSDYEQKTTTKTIPYTGVTVYYNYNLATPITADSGGVAGVPSYTSLAYWTTSRSGYTFVGWADTGTDTAADWPSGARTPTSNETWYAVWKNSSGTRSVSETLTHTFYKTSSSDYEQKTTTKTTPYTGVTKYFSYDLGVETPDNSTGTAGTPTYTNLAYWTTSRSGYEFAGWADGSTDTEADWTGSARTPISNETWYAVWYNSSGTRSESVTLTHRFYKTSGSDYTDKTTTKTTPYTGVTKYFSYNLGANRPLTTGGTAGTPTGSELEYWTTTRSNYDFVGWADTSTDAAADWTGSSKYPTANTNWYAVWSASITYTVNYNANGHGTAPSASSGSTTQTYNYNISTNGGNKTISITTRGAISATGYTQLRWDSKSDDSGTDYALSTACNFTTASTGSTTLFAIWRGNTYSVRFNKNGASGGSMAVQTGFVYGVAKALSPNGFTDSWTFCGWATSLDRAGTGNVDYADQANMTYGTTVDGGTVDLYAVWKNGVTFYHGSNKAQSTVVYSYWKDGSGAQAVVAPTAAQCTDISGWSELGWRADGTASTASVAFSGSVSPSTSWTWYAVYSRTVHFYSGLSTNKTNTSVTQYYNSNNAYACTTPTAATCTDISGWTELGWRVDTTATTAAYGYNTSYTGSADTFYAVYSRTLTISYTNGGGTGTAPSNTTTTQYYNTYGNITSPSVTLAANTFTRTGYTFAGWGLGAAGSSYTWSVAVGGSASQSTAAQWSINTYTLTAYNGYWVANPSSTITVTASAADGSTVTLSSGGTTTTNGTITVAKGATFTVSHTYSSTTITVTETRTNSRTHTIWAYNGSDSGTNSHSGTWTPTANGSWYYYVREHYSVAASGSTGVSSATVTAYDPTWGSNVTENAASGVAYYGNKITYTGSASAGYTWQGWYTAANGGGTRLTTDTSYVINSLTTDYSYYAYATANSYNITVNSNSGTGGSASPATYSTSTSAQSSTLTRPTYSSHHFRSWSVSWTDSTHSGTLPTESSNTLSIPANCYGNVTVTANWYTDLSDPAQSGSLTYNGGSQSPSWTSAYDSTKMTLGGTTSGTDASSYTATFTPKDGYCWSNGSTSAKNVSWSIGVKALTVSWTTTSLTYNGAEQKPAASVSTGVTSETIGFSYTVTAKSGSSLTNGKSVNVGNYHIVASATVSGGRARLANYSLSPLEKDFSITAKSLTSITLSSTSYTYNGSAQGVPSATVKSGDTTLTVTTHYTLSGNGTTQKTDVGTYTITATGKGNYTGTVSATWKINQYTGAITVTLSPTSYTYNGGEQGVPTATVKIGTTTLPASDYTLSGTGTSKHTDVGSYRITATGKNTNLGSSVTAYADWSITAKAITSITLSPTSYTYNGAAQGVPSATVKSGDTTLTKTTHYELSGNGTTQKTDVGTYTITATGKGNYTGTVSATWTINQYTGAITVTLSPTSYTYNGSAQGVPTETVKIGSTPLPASDYTLSGTGTSTHTDVGTYRITATGKGGNLGSSVTAYADWSINAKALTISAYSVTWTGATTYARNGYGTGVGTETLNLTYTPYSTNVGTYTYATSAASGKFTLAKANGTGKASNYTISGAGDFTINNATLSGSVSISGTATYGETLTANVTNTNSASLTYQWYMSTTSATSGGTAISGATGSTYVIGQGLVEKYIYVVVSASKANYSSTTWANKTAAVGKRAYTVSATANSKTYDGSVLTLTYTTSGTLATAHTYNKGATTYTDTITVTTLSTSSADAGSYTVTPTVVISHNGTNVTTSDYAVTVNSATGTINAKALTISAYSATWTGATTYARNGYGTGVGSETLNLTYTPYSTNVGTYTYATSAASGKFTLAKANGTGKASNYSISTAGDFTITAKALTSITLSPTSYTYNGVNQGVPTETVKSGETTLTKTTHYELSGNGTTQQKDVGTYTITATGKGNYTGTVSATWTINQYTGAITVTLSPTSYTYNGGEQGVPTATVKIGTTTLPASDYTLSGTGTSKHTDVGSYRITATGKGGNLGTGVTAYADWSIVTLGISIPTSPAHKIYNGASQAHGIIYETGAEIVTASSTTSAIDAGTYSVVFKVDSNHKWSDGTVTNKTVSWVIDPKSLTVSWSSASLVYNGAGQHPTASVTTGVTEETIGFTYTVTAKTGSSLTSGVAKNVGSYNVAIATSTVSGGRAKIANYSLSPLNTDFEITKKKATITLSSYAGTIKYDSSLTVTITYDGDGTVSAASANTTYVLVASTNTSMSVGVIAYAASTTVNVTVSATAGSNYSAPDNKTYVVTLAQRDLTITAKPQTITYGGSIAQGVSQVTLSGDGLATGDTLAAITLTASDTNATTNGTITPSAARIEKSGANVTGYYDINYVAGVLKIDKHAASITLDPTSATIIYGNNTSVSITYVGDGTLTASSNASSYASVALANNKQSMTITAAAWRADTVTITVSATAGANYLATSASFVVTLEKRAITITGASASKTYDGTPLTSNSSSLTSGTLASGDTATYSASGTITDVGTANNVPNVVIKKSSTDVTSYYSITKVNGTLEITAKTLTITADNKSVVYGNALPTYTYSVSGLASGDTTAVITTEPTLTCGYKLYGNVGEYNIVPSGAVATNYTISYVNGTLTVTQREVTITWSTPTTWVFDNNTHSVSATAGNLVNSDEISFTYTGTTSAKDVGNYTATISGLSGTKKGNYKLPGSGLSQSWSITPLGIAIPSNPAHLTYNGASQNHNVSIPTGASVYATGSTTSAIDAGTYNLILQVDGNHKWNDDSTTNKTVVWGIDAKSVAVVWTNGTPYTYSGAHQAPTAAVNSGVTGETINLTITLKNSGNTTVVQTIEAGSYTANASIGSVSGGRAKAANYTLTNVVAAYVIQKSSSSLAVTNGSMYVLATLNLGTLVTAHDGSLTYTIKSQTTTGSAISSATLTAGTLSAANDNNGSVVVTVNDAGDVNHSAASKDLTVTVSKYSVTITLTADATISYGATGKTISAATSTTPAGAAAGVTVGAVTYAVTTGNSLTVNSTTGALTTVGIGTSTITASAASTTTVKAGSATKNIEVVKAGLTVTVNKNVSIKYGNSDNVTVTVKSSVTNAAVSGLTVTASGAETYVIKSVSDYTISNLGYKITPSAQTVTVSVAGGTYYNNQTTTYTVSVAKRSITITSANDSKVYNGSALTNHDYTITGDGLASYKAGGDASAVADVITLSWTGTATNVADTANNNNTFSVSTLKHASTDVLANYEITKVYGKLTITAASLTIKADNKSTNYGQAVPTWSYTATGFVNGETTAVLGGTASYTIKNGSTPFEPSTTTAVGSYTITVSGLTAANYTITFTDGTWTVGKSAGTLTLTDVEVTYDSVSHSITVSSSGGTVTYSTTENGTYSGTNPSYTDVGTYTVWAKLTGDANHSNVAPKSATIKINAKSISVTWGSTTSWTYDGNNHVPTVTTPVNGAGSEKVNLTVSGEQKNVGNYTATASIDSVTGGQAKASNYTLTNTTKAFSITAKAITVTADDKTMTYGGSAPEFTYTPSGLVGSDTLSGTAAYTVDSTATGSVTFATLGAGSHTIGVSGLSNSNYTITFVDGTLTVNKKALTVTANNKSTTYGDAVPTWSYTATGFVNGETTAVLGGTASYTIKNGSTPITPSTTTAVGSYTISVGGLTAANYTITFNNGTWTVGKAAGTLTLTDVEVTYDSASHSITVSSSGGTVTYSTTENGTYSGTNPSYTDVGTYTVWAKLTGDANHSNVAPKSATVKINAKSISVTWGSTTSWTYDGNNHAPTVTTPVNGAGSEKVNLTVSGEQKNVGNYTATASIDTVTGGQAKASNYTLTNTTKSFSITAKAITVTADDKNMTYGGSQPTFTYTATGLVGSDTLSGTPAYKVDDTAIASVAFATLSAGSHTIAVSGLSNSNYTITFNNGTLTVNKKALTVTADNKSTTYGDAVPTWSYTATGFVNGETTAVLGGTASYTIKNGSTPITPATNTPVGSYTITVSGLTAANYTITFTDGTWTIGKKALTITADDKSTNYGDAVPTWTYTATGLISGETEAVLGGSASYTIKDGGTTITPASTTPVGTYTIYVSGLTSSNYSITFNTGDWVVNAATLTSITLSPTSYTYNGAAQGVPTATVKSGSTILALTTHYTLSGNGTSEKTNVGTYTITATGAGNYTGTVSASWTITKYTGALTVVLSPSSYTYTGSAQGAPSVVVKIGDNILPSSDYTLSGDITAKTNADTYTIIATGSDTNLGTAATGSANWVINPAALTSITLSQASYTYNGAAQGVPSATVKFNTTVLTVATDYTLSGTGTTTQTNVGTYTITATGTGNYTGTVSADWTINKYTGALTVVLTPDSYTYTGSPQGAPSVVVKIGDNTLPSSDYTLSGDITAKTNADTYTIIATGSDTNLGTAATGSANWVINPAALTEITLSQASYTYNGAAQGVPTATVKSGSTILALTTHYTLSGNGTSEKTNVGTYTITATGTGNYTGTVSATWTINQYTGAITVVLTPASYTYNGEPQGTPDVVVKIGDNTLPAADYDLSGTGTTAQTNAGTYRVTATGKGGNLATSVTNYADWVINAAKLATPSGLVWQTLGTAKWNASAAVTGITTTYQVVLYKGNSAVETYNSISALVKDCTTEIRENETGTYYFTVRAMSSNTTNCENSDVSAKVSTGLAASKVTISKQTGIATATIAGASSYVIIQNETGVALVATTSKGYSFASWSASPSLLTIAGSSSASTTTSYTVGTASDITLTVTATLDTFSIVFNKNANDATGTMSNLTVTYNTPITLTANGFSRISHTFRGWATTTTGAVAYQDEATLNASAVNAIYDIVGKNGNYNIYAVWHFDSLITINSIYYSDSTTVCDACAMGFVKIQNASYSYTFMLNRGETYTISDLPVGTYTVVPFASINHTATSKVENISGTTISITVANSNVDVEVTITKTGTANFYASTSAPLAQQNNQGAGLEEVIEYVENNEAYDYNSEVQDVIESTEDRQELDILSLSAEYIETPAYEEYVMAEKLLPNKKEFVSSKEVLYTMLEDKRQFLG